MSDRVEFKHVEVICEGYDYPEDDYILVGSCGLEFTLDYTSPHDHHERSYYRHMDDHEKEMHRKKVIEKHGFPPKEPSPASPSTLFSSLIAPLTFLQEVATFHLWLVVTFLLMALFTILVVRFLTSNGGRVSGGTSSIKKKPIRVSTYGPLTSAVMSTKKAC